MHVGTHGCDQRHAPRRSAKWNTNVMGVKNAHHSLSISLHIYSNHSTRCRFLEAVAKTAGNQQTNTSTNRKLPLSLKKPTLQCTATPLTVSMLPSTTVPPMPLPPKAMLATQKQSTSRTPLKALKPLANNSLTASRSSVGHNSNPASKFQCKWCNVSYAHRSSLSRHLATVHPSGEKGTICCNLCTQKYKRPLL